MFLQMQDDIALPILFVGGITKIQWEHVYNCKSCAAGASSLYKKVTAIPFLPFLPVRPMR